MNRFFEYPYYLPSEIFALGNTVIQLSFIVI